MTDGINPTENCNYITQKLGQKSRGYMISVPSCKEPNKMKNEKRKYRREEKKKEKEKSPDYNA